MATERGEQDYLQVFFNDLKLPVLKEWVQTGGTVIKSEILEYDLEKKLVRRYVLDENKQAREIIQFGVEPWSFEFRKVISKVGTRLDYTEQRSHFSVDDENRINLVQFITVGGHAYGEIQFYYDHLSMLIGENWRTLPDRKSVRKFAYAYDLLSREREIWEYGSSGEEISHVSMSFADQDSLYKYPAPRTGNRLDEVALILDDIKSLDIIIPEFVFIPKYEYDIIILLTGERIDIDFIAIQNRNVQFSLAGTDEKLSLPLVRVSTIINKFGEKIFPGKF
ncbi:MAG: hypothetical protein V3S48_03470 [Candidatus Neomarinimicrobiota bacterium]